MNIYMVSLSIDLLKSVIRERWNTSCALTNSDQMDSMDYNNINKNPHYFLALGDNVGKVTQ